jgi:Family of unknown function (DUF6220)
VVEAVYRVWAAIVVAAVLLQIGFAGYGAFYVASKVDDNPVSQDTFDEGWGLHLGFGYLVVLLGLVFLLIALGGRVGRQRTLRVLGLFGLMILQVVLAWFGEAAPFIGILHPINAFLILGLSSAIAYQAWRTPARVEKMAPEPAA